ncbi:MAG: YjbH domain-containing protein, partial [Gemmatimonadaceae bacterium]|nr:YjbH domain-containing protein [Gemmatimonadaceae bacterium]
DERGRRPALAVGIHDISGANALYTAKYVALTKSVAGRLRVTAGYGSGISLLDGPFGGIEFAPCRWMTLIAEHDGRRSSGGVRLHPFPALADRLGVRPSLDASWLGEQGFVAGVGLRLAAGPARQHRPLPARERAEAPRDAFAPPDVPLDHAARNVRDALVAAGLENVRVLPVQDGLLSVDYENRRWLLDDLDALGAVLGMVAANVPDSVAQVRLTVRKLDLPVLTVITALSPWRAYLNDPRSEGAFLRQLKIAYPPRTSSSVEGAAVNRSQFRLDFSARPRVETLLLSELGALETRVAVLPEFTAQLGRGLAITGRRAVPVSQSANFITELADPGADRLLLHAAARLPQGLLPTGALGVGQLSIGRLGQRQVGAQWEQNVEIAGGRWAVGVTGAAYGETAARLEHSYVFGTVRWRRPQQDLEVSLQAGRYRFGDVGGVAEVSRRFGLAEVGFFLRATDLSSQAGVRATVPLSPRRQLRPAAVRVVLPDYFEHVEDVTVFEPIPIVRTDVARTLDVGFGVEQGYNGRGWLNEATVRARAWALRNAALREQR